MLKTNLLLKLQKDNNGILCTDNVIKHGISKTYLADYVRNNSLERVAKGIYVAKGAWPDDLYIMQLRFNGIIYSHETALYLLDLAEREPLQYTATVKTSYNYSSLSALGVKVYSIKKELFELGLTEVQSPNGHKLKCYNAERTICDILRSRKNIEIQDLQAALKTYTKSKSKNIPLLMRYAKELHVDKILRRYLEVLL